MSQEMRERWLSATALLSAAASAAWAVLRGVVLDEEERLAAKLVRKQLLQRFHRETAHKKEKHKVNIRTILLLVFASLEPEAESALNTEIQKIKNPTVAGLAQAVANAAEEDLGAIATELLTPVTSSAAAPANQSASQIAAAALGGGTTVITRPGSHLQALPGVGMKAAANAQPPRG
jgi:hypothetical protein